MKTLRVAVTGGREHQITQEEERAFVAILGEEFHQAFLAATQEKELAALVLLHGACRGVDQRAAELAEGWGYAVVPFEAPWDFEVYGPDAGRGRVQLGPAAGPLRNRIMLEAADLLVAFPGGRGTADCVRQAEELGVRVVRVGE